MLLKSPQVIRYLQQSINCYDKNFFSGFFLYFDPLKYKNTIKLTILLNKAFRALRAPL